MKIIFVLFLSAGLLHGAAHDAQEDFIVQSKPQVQKKLSRSKLKEELGQVAKELFSETTALVKRLGTYLQLLAEAKAPTPKSTKLVPMVPATGLHVLGAMHHHVAYLQTTCGQLAESLLDDEPHLGKASKVALTSSLQTMRDALSTAKKCHLNVAPADKATATLEGHAAALCGVVDRMKSDACLRHA